MSAAFPFLVLHRKGSNPDSRGNKQQAASYFTLSLPSTLFSHSSLYFLFSLRFSLLPAQTVRTTSALKEKEQAKVAASPPSSSFFVFLPSFSLSLSSLHFMMFLFHFSGDSAETARLDRQELVFGIEVAHEHHCSPSRPTHTSRHPAKPPNRCKSLSFVKDFLSSLFSRPNSEPH